MNLEAAFWTTFKPNELPLRQDRFHMHPIIFYRVLQNLMEYTAESQWVLFPFYSFPWTEEIESYVYSTGTSSKLKIS